MSSVELAFDSACDVGESPTWDPHRNRLLWVDILAGVVYAGHPGVGGSVSTVYRSQRPVGAIRPLGTLGSDRWVTVEQSRLVAITGDGSPEASLEFGPRSPDLRSNDAEPDAVGRLLVGVMEFGGEAGRGSLQSVDPAGTVTEILTDLAIPNGLAWTPDGCLFVDSPDKLIGRFAYDLETGAMDRRGVFADLSSFDAVPDGIAADSDGLLYVAMWGLGAVLVIDPRGTVIERIEVPAPQVTSCAFGGPDATTLYITTANHGYDEAQCNRWPRAGAVFAVERAVPGAARHPHRADWADIPTSGVQGEPK